MSYKRYRKDSSKGAHTRPMRLQGFGAGRAYRVNYVNYLGVYCLEDKHVPGTLTHSVTATLVGGDVRFCVTSPRLWVFAA